MKFIIKGRVNLKSALIQAMAWRRTGDNPLPEDMLNKMCRHMASKGYNAFNF